MAQVDDKARFYLERAVPQLREFEEKEIFSKDEIRTLVQKRTDHERTILSPGSKPEDFLAYVSWEQALDKLRARRCRRLKIRQSSGHATQARIFQTFERSVTRHPGSGELWRRYLEFANEVGATKQWRRVMTRALRMLPTDAGLWVAAGQRAAQDGDMEGARSLFMRGCRFCTADVAVWVEYARVEMGWLARLERKKGINGPAAAAMQALLEASSSKDAEAGEDSKEQILFDDRSEDDDDDDEDKDDFGRHQDAIAIQALIDDKLKSKAAASSSSSSDSKAMFNAAAVQQLAASPALDGAIPQAIFDVAARQPFFGATAAEAFFDMLATFAGGVVSAQPRLSQHVLDTMMARFASDAATWNCRAKQALLAGTAVPHPDAPTFPRALRAALATLREGLAQTKDEGQRARLVAKSAVWLDGLLARPDLDEGIRAVVEDAKRKMERA